MTNPFEKLKSMRDLLPPGPTPAAEKKPELPAPLRGKIVIRHERKGRAGKTVTLIQGIGGGTDAVETLARELKKSLGCGATVEEGVIVLQGELVERAATLLESRGARQVIRGT